jgi:hypothetical protein
MHRLGVGIVGTDVVATGPEQTAQRREADDDYNEAGDNGFSIDERHVFLL